jgi:predicted MFS family arabinose efflux permease
MRQPRLWLILLATVLSTAAYMVTFNYLAEILTRVTRIPEVWIYGRVFTVASDAPTLAGATTVSAVQLGISVVPLMAGVALDAGAPITAVGWIGAGLAAVTIPVALLERIHDRN